MLSADMNRNYVASKRIRETPIWWVLFDFANSILLTTGGIYFLKLYLQKPDTSQIVFNYSLSVSAAIGVVTCIYLARRINSANNLFGFVTASSIGVVTSAAIIVSFFASGNAILELYGTLIAFCLLTIFYQVSIILHNVLLVKSLNSSRYSENSGYSTAANWTGSLVAVLLSMLVLSGHVPLIQNSLIGVVLFAIIAASPLLFYSIYKMNSIGQLALKDGVLTTPDSDFTSVQKTPAHFIFFLVAYLLFMDSAISIQNNLTVSLSQLYGLGDNQIGAYFLSILLGAVAGALLAGFNKLVITKPYLYYLPILIFALASILVGIGKNSSFLYLSCAMAGLAVGAFETASRASLAALLPDSSVGLGMSLFAAVQRLSNLVGPAIWATTLLAFGGGVVATQAAFMALAAITLLSIPIFIISELHRQKTT